MKRDRQNRLAPNGAPKYVRCYDNGDRSFDRYTVVFTGRYRHKTGGDYIHLGMSAHPYHPQGFGQHGSSRDQIDINAHGYAPAVGRSNHLGKRIRFTDLPADCQRCAWADYAELWDIKAPQDRSAA